MNTCPPSTRLAQENQCDSHIANVSRTLIFYAGSALPMLVRHSLLPPRRPTLPRPKPERKYFQSDTL